MVSLVARLSVRAGEGYGRRYASMSRFALPGLVLLDGTDRPLLLGEGIPEDLASPPDFRYPVGLPLPHWQLAVYRRPDGERGISSLTRVATVLVVVMVVAILGGGATLFADARRSRRDARQRTTFVANVSHELKTPLTTIRMYAELLRDERVADAERRRRFLDTMVQEGERLTRLIDNVLDFGRLEQSRRRYHPRTVDLAEELRAVVETERSRCAAAGLDLRADLPDDLSCETDPDAVRQIVLNLLENAAKYAGDGGLVRVSLAADETHNPPDRAGCRSRGAPRIAANGSSACSCASTTPSRRRPAAVSGWPSPGGWPEVLGEIWSVLTTPRNLVPPSFSPCLRGVAQ